ncbi:MAG: asparagine synthetase B, partial [Deltaproteobacteria bacterium]|nr:asparagine synthetase B [Deltaproteobacteria bacterium]
MCGIAGIVGLGASRDRVSAMSAAIRHRGPDGDGLFVGQGVALAHRRLKVIDLSAAAAQPMTSADGRKVIVFNGEIYNYKALRRELGDERFRSHSDTEVLLASVERWGADALARLDGMFAFAVWDTVERSLLCARDRLGIKPFYLSRQGEDFLFASELCALFVAGVSREPNEAVLYDFLARDFYNHTDDTFFRDVTSLPAGTFLLIESGRRHAPRRYWDLAAESAAVEVPSDRVAR